MDIFTVFTVAAVFRVVDLLGVFANAMLGGVVAREERLDPIGYLVLAVLTGLGGGLLRDVLLQHGTPIALSNPAYLITAFAGAGVSYLIRIRGRAWEWTYPVVDALALGAWSAAGATKTLAVGLGWMPAVLLGTVTAVGGGAIRDIVLRRVPGVLGGNTLYATCGIVASGVAVICSRIGHPTIGLLLSTVVGAGLCLVARWRGWILPSADAWSPRSVIPSSYRRRIRERIERRRATRERAARD